MRDPTNYSFGGDFNHLKESRKRGIARKEHAKSAQAIIDEVSK